MAGRPRDPDLDQRVRDAACAVYGNAGWSGFSLDAVAREAGVGKAAIYRRWESKHELLTDALSELLIDPADIDNGELRADLVELATRYIELYSGEGAEAVLRLMVEGRTTPEMAGPFDLLRAAQARAARDLVKRGIARGDIPGDAPVTTLLDTLLGGMLMHSLMQPTGAGSTKGSPARQAEVLVAFIFGSIASKETND